MVAFASFGCGTVGSDPDDGGAAGAIGSAGRGGAAGSAGTGGFTLTGEAGRGGAAGSAAAGGAGGGAVCVHGGVSHPVGSSFPDTDGCNTCSCTTSGIACTARACLPDAGTDGASDGPTGATCALPASYSYGEIGGFVAYTDQAVLGPTEYRYARSPSGLAAEPIACAPPLPACDTPNAIDIADIKRDLAHPDVQAALSLKSPPLYGRDTRPNDLSVFALTASTGGGFLLGTTCPASASSCIAIPAGIAKLVADLRALDQQQPGDPACKGLGI